MTDKSAIRRSEAASFASALVIFCDINEVTGFGFSPASTRCLCNFLFRNSFYLFVVKKRTANYRKQKKAKEKKEEKEGRRKRRRVS